MALGNVFDRIANTRVLDLPIGKAALILATIGVGKGLSDVVAARWPNQAKYAGLIAGGGLAYAAKKIGAVRNFLGETGAETFAIGGIAAAILSFYDIQGKIQGWIATKLSPKATETPGGVTPSGGEEGMMTGIGEFGQFPGEYKSDVERKLEAIRQAQLARL